MDIFIKGVKNPETITREDIVSLVGNPDFKVEGLDRVPENFTVKLDGPCDMENIELVLYFGEISRRPVSSGLVGIGIDPKERVTMIVDEQAHVSFSRYTFDGVTDKVINVRVSASTGSHQAAPLTLIKGGKYDGADS